MENIDFAAELAEKKNEWEDRELELERLKTCYIYASGDDKKVVWAVLNKYVPMLSAEGLI